MRNSNNPKIQTSQNPKIQKSRKMQDSVDVKSFCFFDFEFLCFWIFFGFWVLQLCFQSVETDPRLDAEKGSVCVGIYSVLKGCACGRGGDHTYVYIYIAVETTFSVR